MSLNLLFNEKRGFTINLNDYDEIKNFIYPVLTTELNDNLFLVKLEDTNIYSSFIIATFNGDTNKADFIKLTTDIYISLKQSANRILNDAMMNLKNTNILHYPIYEEPLEDIYYSFLSDESPKKIGTTFSLIKNNCGHFASSYIFDKIFLKECSERLGTSFYIFPISIHELVLMQEMDYSVYTVKAFAENYKQSYNIDKNNFLSNDIYYYDNTKDNLIIIT